MSDVVGLSYAVSRGDANGMTLSPHLHEDGKYVASMTRFEKDYVRVESIRELAILVKHGFSVRMSCPGNAPSLISPGSIQIASSDPSLDH